MKKNRRRKIKLEEKEINYFIQVIQQILHLINKNIFSNIINNNNIKINLLDFLN